MLMTNEELFESALKSRAPDQALWDLCGRLLDTGTTHEKLEEELIAFMLKLREQGREGDEERIGDVTDAVTGWCGPNWSLVSRGR
jgi:hypothetical protein